MRVCRVLVLAVLLHGVVATAQDFPAGEFYLGHTLFQAEPGVDSHVNNRSGWAFGLTRNFNSHAGFTFDFATQYENSLRSRLLLRPFGGWRGGQFLVGPTVGFGGGRWRVHLRALGGASHQRMDGFALTSGECLQRGINCAALGGLLQPDGSFVFPGNQAIKWAYGYGGGLDFELGRGAALRLIQLDSLWLRSVDPTLRWQRLLRAEAGLVFRF